MDICCSYTCDACSSAAGRRRSAHYSTFHNWSEPRGFISCHQCPAGRVGAVEGARQHGFIHLLWCTSWHASWKLTVRHSSGTPRLAHHILRSRINCHALLNFICRFKIKRSIAISYINNPYWCFCNSFSLVRVSRNRTHSLVIKNESIWHAKSAISNEIEKCHWKHRGRQYWQANRSWP